MAAIFDFQLANPAELTSSLQRTFVPNEMLISQFARLSRASAPLHFFPLHSFCHALFYRIDRIIIAEIWGDEEIGQICR